MVGALPPSRSLVAGAAPSRTRGQPPHARGGSPLTHAGDSEAGAQILRLRLRSAFHSKLAHSPSLGHLCGLGDAHVSVSPYHLQVAHSRTCRVRSPILPQAMLPAKANLYRGWATAVPSPTQGFAPGCVNAPNVPGAFTNRGNAIFWTPCF